jgi:hypothetical protein
MNKTCDFIEETLDLSIKFLVYLSYFIFSIFCSIFYPLTTAVGFKICGIVSEDLISQYQPLTNYLNKKI